MSLRSSMGVSRYASGEQDVQIATGGIQAGLRGVVYCHASGADATSNRDYIYPGIRHLADALAQTFPVLSIDAGGTQNWGNPTSRARVGDAVAYGQGALGWKSGTVLLVGVSMGFATAMNYAQANPSKVAAIVGIIPAVDLNDIVTNNRAGAASYVNTAYGGTYSEATHGPTGNPSNYKASITVPIQLWYASDDTTVIPSTVTAFDTAVASCTATSVGALGHTQAAIDAAPRDQIVSFLQQYA